MLTISLFFKVLLLEGKVGTVLQLTILNKSGRIWTMVAGGGASVIYSDTICDLGGASDLANYGEYSGAPSEQQTYEYAKTILGLMCQEKHPKGKVNIYNNRFECMSVLLQVSIMDLEHKFRMQVLWDVTFCHWVSGF
jgi:succinyl-CoA synthetase beta subunit